MAVIWYVLDHVGMGKLGGLFHTGEEAQAYIDSKKDFGHFIGKYDFADAVVDAEPLESMRAPVSDDKLDGDETHKFQLRGVASGRGEDERATVRESNEAKPGPEQHEPAQSTMSSSRPASPRQSQTQRGKDD